MDIHETNQLIRSFQSRYGEKEGLRIYMTVMPGILKDFNEMLKKSKEGENIREEYRIEDGKAAVILQGAKEKGKTKISSVKVI